MSSKTDQKIKELLGNGLSNDVVASTVGVTPAYISQLMSEETFKQDVIEKRTQTLASHTIRDRSLDKIEDSLIERIGAAVEDHTIYKPQDLLRTFMVINGAKRRGVGVQEALVQTNKVVNLTISQKVVNKFTTNVHNEIVAIGDRDLTTIPATSLLKKLARDNQEKATTYNKVARFLPGVEQGNQGSQGNLTSEDKLNGPQTARAKAVELLQRQARERAERSGLTSGIEKKG